MPTAARSSSAIRASPTSTATGKITADDRTFIGDSYPGMDGSLLEPDHVPRLRSLRPDHGEVELHVRRRHAAQLLRPLQQRRGSGLLDADESDEQEPGADHGRRRPTVRVDAPLHRRVALAHPQHHGGLHVRSALRAAASGCRAFASTARRRTRTSIRITSASIRKCGGAVPTLRTLLIGSNIVW